MNDDDEQFPPSTLRHLEMVPKDRPVAILLRHSLRNELPSGEAGNTVPITTEGKRLAVRLGEILGGRLRRLHTSPVLRCVQTAECLNAGASTNHAIVRDSLLGDPGVYVLDPKLAWSNWTNLGHDGVMDHLATSLKVLPGMAPPAEAARRLARHVVDVAGDDAGLHVFVTHDLLVLATVARLVRKVMGPADWPWYLEGAFLWRAVDGIRVEYRDFGDIYDGA